MHQSLTALYFVNPSTLIRFFSVEVKKISDRILLLDNINVEKLLPEILKILKLDNKKSMAVLEHPNGSGNVGKKFHFELRERNLDNLSRWQRQWDSWSLRLSWLRRVRDTFWEVWDIWLTLIQSLSSLLLQEKSQKFWTQLSSTSEWTEQSLYSSFRHRLPALESFSGLNRDIKNLTNA